jgi:hypothetical protein
LPVAGVDARPPAGAGVVAASGRHDHSRPVSRQERL